MHALAKHREVEEENYSSLSFTMAMFLFNESIKTKLSMLDWKSNELF